METRDTVFLIVMVLSSFLLSFEWLRRFTYKPENPFIDPLIIISIMILTGTLSLMLISINNKLQDFEDKIEARDRALRVNMESSDTKIEERMNELSTKVDNAVYEFNRRKYHWFLLTILFFKRLILSAFFSRLNLFIYFLGITKYK